MMSLLRGITNCMGTPHFQSVRCSSSVEVGKSPVLTGVSRRHYEEEGPFFPQTYLSSSHVNPRDPYTHIASFP